MRGRDSWGVWDGYEHTAIFKIDNQQGLTVWHMEFCSLLKQSKQEKNLKKNAAAAAKSLQSCPTLCDPIDSSPPGSFVHEIFQARILEWVAIPFSRG